MQAVFNEKLHEQRIPLGKLRPWCYRLTGNKGADTFAFLQLHPANAASLPAGVTPLSAADGSPLLAILMESKLRGKGSPEAVTIKGLFAEFERAVEPFFSLPVLSSEHAQLEQELSEIRSLEDSQRHMQQRCIQRNAAPVARSTRQTTRSQQQQSQQPEQPIPAFVYVYATDQRSPGHAW